MLKHAIDWLVYSVFGFDPESRLAGVFNFFLYDSVKILLLLSFMITILGFARSYISREKFKNWVEKKGILGNL
ncbi:MAG: permease, partial [Candidatus Omnitrophota bacterium]